MKSSPRINVVISAHGFGHLTQTVAVLQALSHRYENMTLRIQCALERSIIAARLGQHDFEHERIPMDVGLVQPDPLNVDMSSSLEAYAIFHQHFDENIKTESLKLKNWGADIVFSNISYLALAAASSAAIPGIALASLTWDHIVKAYFDLNAPEVHAWYQQIQEAYRQSTLALLPEPALVGKSFEQVKHIAPVYIPGQRNSIIRDELGLKTDDNRALVLCTLGGIASAQIPAEAMLKQKDFHWIVDMDRTLPSADHMHTLAQLAHWPYRDVIASVDAVIGKPGYGTAVEVAAHDLPFVYTRRGHFPDEPIISEWLDRHTRSLEISNADWFAGNFTQPLETLWQRNKKPGLAFNGAEQAAEIISDIL